MLFSEVFRREDFGGGPILDQKRSALDYLLLFDYG
jgi:hypothetical protein